VLDTLDGRKASARPRSRRTKSHRPSAPPRPPRKGKAAP
jgi:hypothetical protein